MHRGVRWRATSAKMVKLNAFSNNSGKSVGAILRGAFERVPTVIMANM
jgi:hypothetical protein